MKNESAIYGLIRFGKTLNKYRNSSDNKFMQKIYDKIHKDMLKEINTNTIEDNTKRQTKDF